MWDFGDQSYSREFDVYVLCCVFIFPFHIFIQLIIYKFTTIFGIIMRRREKMQETTYSY